MNHRWVVFACMVVGCGVEEVHETPRSQEPLPPGCSAGTGDSESCVGCPIERDLEWTCEGENRLEAPSSLAMNGEHVYADYQYETYGGSHSIVFEGDDLLFRTPPSTNYAGLASTGTDGTVYYHYPAAAYQYTSDTEWQEVGIAGLPEDFDIGFGFHVRPSANGELHATFRTWSAYYFATRVEDLSWKWFLFSSYDDNSAGHYVGVDAWDRPYVLFYADDGEEPQTMIQFLDTSYSPVGTSGKVGRVAEPPRPTTVYDRAPIHVLREGPASLELLSIVDGDDWLQADVEGTQLIETCPGYYYLPAKSNECVPCHSESSGIEDGAFDIAQTSDGAVWASWFEVSATIDVEYEPIDKKAFVLCRGDVSSTQSGKLHVAELDKHGKVMRSLVVPFADLGLNWRYGTQPTRELSMAAWDRRVAVMFPTHQRGPDEPDAQALTMRMLVFDTSMF